MGAAEDGGYFDFISTRYGMGVKWREAQEEDEQAQEQTFTARAAVRAAVPEYRQLIDDSGTFEVVKV